MSTQGTETVQTRRLVRSKPVREMIGTTASAITAGMVATRDVIQALGFEAKTMKLESYMDYKVFFDEACKELNMSKEELEAIMA